jgi:hypothetical protein
MMCIAVCGVVKQADWKATHRDLAPFLEKGSEIEMMQEEFFLSALNFGNGHS